jgi:pilus assembly protein CpaE
LAGALQTRGFRVVIVDMDLQLATLSASLEVKLERSLAELVMETLSAEGPIRSAFDQHKSGVSLIAQEERISEISAVTPERLPRFFSALKQGFDVILVDGLRNFSDLAVAVMDEADMVLLPVTQDIPAVRSARKVLKLFTRLGYEGGKARVILNRFHRRSLVTPEVIEEHLRCVISERLPNDFRFVSQGLTEGELLHQLDPQHPFCLAIDRLAAQLMGFPKPDQRQGLLKRIGRALRRS